MPLPLQTKTCPDCGTTFRTIRTAQGSHRYCWQCRKKRWKLIHSGGYLTPRPRFRPPARRDERGMIH